MVWIGYNIELAELVYAMFKWFWTIFSLGAPESSKQDYKNNSCTQFAREGAGLWPIYNSYVKERKLFTRKFAQRILNHLGFATSAIKLCFM